jgi:hypothetical protein
MPFPVECAYCGTEPRQRFAVRALKHLGWHLEMVYGNEVWICPSCTRGEPGDPDGETHRGGESAAYEREQQADIQRNLK